MLAYLSMWNFLKLDTRNGKVSIVQFSVEDNKNRFEYALSDVAHLVYFACPE